ncbi:hypothetical protein CFC21_065191 [Triticum aestivum]|uniref:Uncharacterized protein n=3 Tax=Triticum TaxID=4564 RepID=A0A9R0WLC1_TRITD|nr:uncharacterized protein LOC119300893 [Triticum dicoccoides]XP_044380542.1 uncharacterized protein LOC123103113 [Triticum aestivum]KAF7058052.1 hypothetical protein CFC21_065191 [Triticum aestivum]VAI15885.1 unnamed protein product [Triticum turgidum subsp. durum]
MASSAFKSTTRRNLHGSADRPVQPPPHCPRRSRSVTPAPRRDRLLGDYAGTTRTNPLFDRGGRASSPPPPPEDSGDRGRKESRGRGSGRARSVSVAPPQRRRAATSAPSSAGTDGGGGGRASLARSVVGEARPCRGSVTDVETVDLSSKMQSWRSRNSVPSSSYVSVNAISQMSHSTVPVEQVLEIPPEFDPDSTEFVSDISDYATEFKQRDVVEIPLEFDPDATQLVSVERHNATKLQWEGIEIPLEFDPDSVELAPDITEYTSKLKQSHERARKLRADLAVEEQREQELSRMLKGIVTVPSLSETHKRRPRRKSSIERLRVSRHLAEEAISYFEECVSISTLDSTDFSSLEEPHQNSGGTVPRKSNSRFLLKGGSSSLGSHFPTDRHNYNEESDNQTQCSMSITGSDVSDGVVFSHAKSPGLGTRNNSSDDFDTPRSKSSCFSFTHEPVKAVDNCDVRQYLRSFSRVISKERSNYCADDYAVQKVSENRLTDMVAFKNRIEYGGLILCNIRTF